MILLLCFECLICVYSLEIIVKVNSNDSLPVQTRQSAASRSSGRGVARRAPSGTSTPTPRAASSTNSAAVGATPPGTGSAPRPLAPPSALPALGQRGITNRFLPRCSCLHSSLWSQGRMGLTRSIDLSTHGMSRWPDLGLALHD